MFFDYDYFCGSNICVEIDGMIVTEAAAISFGIQESKIPIYGYSSRYFDAVASGQVLIQGSLVVNFVHQDYLFQLIDITRGTGLAQPVVSNLLVNAPTDPALMEDLLAGNLELNDETAFKESIQAKFWDQLPLGSKPKFVVGHNPHDRMDGVNIKITFGERSPGNGYNGQRNMILSDCFFTGKSVPIQIDENVIVESYQFFGRDLMYAQNPAIPQVTIQSSSQDSSSVNTDFGPEITFDEKEEDVTIWSSNPNLNRG